MAWLGVEQAISAWALLEVEVESRGVKRESVGGTLSDCEGFLDAGH